MKAWQSPRWLHGELPKGHEGLSEIACFAMCRDAPGEDTLPWVSKQLRKCGGWSLLSSFDDPHLGVQRIHPGFNITRYLQVSPDILNGTSNLLTRTTKGVSVPGTRLNMELGLLWAARATPAFSWYVSVEPDAVLFTEALPPFLAHYGGSPRGVSAVGAHWLALGSFVLSRPALLEMVDPITGVHASCRRIPSTIRNQDHLVAECMTLRKVSYCSAHLKTKGKPVDCMPTNCSSPWLAYGPWMALVDPTWNGFARDSRPTVGAADVQILHDTFEDFLQGSRCSAGVVGFHPIKDARNHSQMLDAFYGRDLQARYRHRDASGEAKNHTPLHQHHKRNSSEDEAPPGKSFHHHKRNSSEEASEAPGSS